MIAYLEGRYEYFSETAILVITAAGVGYEVEVPTRLRQNLTPGQQVSLYTLLLVREDMWRLCGFATIEERQVFELLIAIPKVGPRLGLGILSAYPPQELRRIIATGDHHALTVVSGIGKRMAESIYRELSYKLKMEAGAAILSDSPSVASVYANVIEGLKGLGYSESECSSLVQDLLREQPELDVSEALRGALKLLARSKS